MNSKEQKAAIEKLSRLKVGALFMEMGTGKTKVALDLIASRRGKIDAAIWICPFSLKKEIESEKNKWQPGLSLDIIGCESIGQSDRIYMEALNKARNGKAFVIVDESLKIKNMDAKRTKRIIEIGKHATYKLILNGTPISKNVLDLYPQMEFLSPKILDMSFLEFKNTYCEYYLHGKKKGHVKKTHNLEHLISKIEPYIFKSELEIEPKKNMEKRHYSVDPAEYETEKERLFDIFFDEDEYSLDFYSFSTGLQKFYTSSKRHDERLDELIEEIGEKVIVFVKFLDGIPEGAARITGQVRPDEREATIRDFENGKFNALYVTYGCGAYGLNLQFCHNTIFSELMFDYANIVQAEARTYRMGQENDVNYYRLVCENSGLERMIVENIDKKGSLSDEIKKTIESMGAKEWVKSI